MELDTKERKKLISKISKALGVDQYALEAKISDQQVIEAAINLEILGLIKVGVKKIMKQLHKDFPEKG